MDTNSTSAPDDLPQLRRALHRAAAALKRAVWFTTALNLGWRVLALLGLFLLLDLVFALPVLIRWGLLAVLVAVISWTVVEGQRRQVRGQGDEWAARLVETQHPEVENALINAIQFGRVLATASPQQAVWMRQEIARGEQLAAHVPPESVAKAGSDTKRQRIRLAIAVGAWAVVTLLFPSVVFTILPRLLAPWLDDITPPFSLTRYEVRPPGASVRVGDSLNLAVTVSGPIPDDICLMTRTARTDWQRVSLASDGATAAGGYSVLLDTIQEDTQFYVRGQGSRSARYWIRVVRPPVVKSQKVTYTFPAYTGRSPQTETVGEEGLHGLAHTQATLEIVSNRPLKGGVVTVADADGKILASAEVQPDTRDTTIGRATFPILRPGTYKIALTAADGQQNPEAAVGKIKLDKDQNPTVWITEPAGDILVTPEMTVAIGIEAEDDNAVADLTLHRLINDLEDSPLVFPMATPTPHVRQEVRLNMADLGVRPGDRITYYATAHDNEPGKANPGETEPFSIKVVDRAEFEETLRQQRNPEDVPREQKDIASAVQDLAKRQQDLAERMEQLAKKLAQNPNDPALQKEFAAAQQEQKKLQEEAEKMAAQIQEYAQSPSSSDLERALKNKLAEVTRQMQASNQAMQAASQSGAPPGDAAKNAANAARQLNSANQQMQKQVVQAIEHLEEIMPLYNDVEQFKDLLDRQGRLVLKAREFQNKSAKTPQDKARLAQIAAEQDQIKEELKQLKQDLVEHAAQCEANFPKAAKSARNIAAEIDRRAIPNLMQSAKDAFLQENGQTGFEKAAQALKEMLEMSPQCEGAQSGDMAGELDINLNRALGQSGLGKSLSQFGPGGKPGSGGMGMMGMGSGTNGSSQRGGSMMAGGPRAYVPSTRMAASGTGGQKKMRHQNTMAGREASLSASDVEVIPGSPTIPPKAVGAETGRYPAEYRKLVNDYFKAVAEQKGPSNGGSKP